MKSGSDRLPRRSGLCVLFHADQLLVISWSPRARCMTRRWISRSRMKRKIAKWWWRWSFWVWCQGKSGWIASPDTASPSESSEFRSCDRASDGMGNDVECAALGSTMVLDTGIDSPFCFFLGCRSMRDDVRCLDRAGTGMVVRVGARGHVTTVVVPEIGSGPGSVIGMGSRGDPVVRIGALSGGERVDAGRRCGSGLITMWEGMPPCDAMVGGPSDVGRDTKVCSPLVVGRSRRRFAGGKDSSYSMEGSKKGKSPAK